MSFRCQRAEQITLFLENRPGIFADLCAHLSDRHVNIRAITTIESTDNGLVRMVVDDPDAAKQILAAAEVSFDTCDCLAVEMPNHPGGFEGLARILSLAGININYIYASGVPGADFAVGILGVSDLERALTLNWGA
jgi:hypothetical protein